MKIFLSVSGFLLVIMGAVWFLQGVNVLPGSFMTGQTKWAVIGAMSLVLGLVLLIAGRTMR